MKRKRRDRNRILSTSYIEEETKERVLFEKKIRERYFLQGKRGEFGHTG